MLEERYAGLLFVRFSRSPSENEVVSSLLGPIPEHPKITESFPAPDQLWLEQSITRHTDGSN